MNWRNLIVTDSYGDGYGTLGDVMRVSPETLDSATIDDDAVVSWDGFFLSSPGEEPDYDTPRCEVDWSGFQEAYDRAVGR